MEYGKRDLMVLIRTDNYTQESLEQEIECLNAILVQVENNAIFCQANELATRTHITRKPKKILKAVSLVELKPFEFIISRN